MGIEDQNLDYPLVIDVSTPFVQAGIACDKNWQKVESKDSNALDGVFQTVSKLLTELKLKFHELDSVFFCSGPGSTLGLRLTLAFIKTLNWEFDQRLKLFSYNALDLANCMISNPPSHIQAPFRMGWRVIRTGTKNNPIGEKEILESEIALKRFPQSLHIQDQANSNANIPRDKIIDYKLEKIKGLEDLLLVSTQVKELEIYNPKPPEFKKWEPKIKFLNP